MFRNEITTILTLSTSEGGGGDGHFFRFGGPSLKICNINIRIYLCGYAKRKFACAKRKFAPYFKQLLQNKVLGSSTEIATIKWYMLFSSTE